MPQANHFKMLPPGLDPTLQRVRSFRKLAICCLALLAIPTPHAYSEDGAVVAIPRSDDQYSKSVKKLEAGETTINYQEFRESFLASAQFKIVGEQKPDLTTLRSSLHELMNEAKYPGVVSVAKKMLSIDYTGMEAHKVLQQTYKILGDTPNRNKYHDIEFGLLNSIVKKGDGKTCRTAWPVIQVAEEYFILDMLGAKVQRQSIDNTGGVCDRMQVQTDEGEKVYYFEISRVFKGYNKQGVH